jgi:hypothetical protein
MMVVMTPPYGVNPAIAVSLAAAIVSVAENEPPRFIKSIGIFDAAPDIDKAFFLRAKLGCPLGAEGPGSSLRFGFRRQNDAGLGNLHAIKVIQVAVIGPFDLDFIAKIFGWQVPYIHKGQMSDDIGLVLHDVNAERFNADIGALKDPGISNLASSDASKNDCKNGNENCCDGKNFVMGSADSIPSDGDYIQHEALDCLGSWN